MVYLRVWAKALIARLDDGFLEIAQGFHLPAFAMKPRSGGRDASLNVRLRAGWTAGWFHQANDWIENVSAGQRQIQRTVRPFAALRLEFIKLVRAPILILFYLCIWFWF